MKSEKLKYVIQECIKNITQRERKEYATLKEIYQEVADFLETENNYILKSQIRGRLQENCIESKSFNGENLFTTEKVRSGKWKNVEEAEEANSKKYIRSEKNNFIITTDNWKSQEEVRTISNEYSLEENLDQVYRIKLCQKIGKERAGFIIKDLDYIRKLLKQKKNIDEKENGYGLSFEVLAVSTIHHISYEESIEKYIVHGSLDGGIDAIYYNGKKVIVYQIKIGNIKDNAYEIMKKNYLDCRQGIEPQNGKDLFCFIQKNKTNLDRKDVIYASVSKNSNKKSNYLPEEIYQKYFENKFLPPSTNELVLIIPKPRIEDGNTLNVSKLDNNNFVFFLSAKKLIEYLLKAINVENTEQELDSFTKYFYDNVRGELKTNKKMLHTIESEPENFVKFNNGVSITGEVYDHGGEIEIMNPVINNGQQTIMTLIKNQENLENVFLSIKITNEVDLEVKSKISEYTNDQVKVKPIDMLSLNKNIRDIQKKIYHSTYHDQNYFLKISSSGIRGYEECLNKLYKDNHIIELLDFIKLYFSIQNKKELGNWKNSPNLQVEKTEFNEPFDLTLSLKVCETNALFSTFLNQISEKKEKDDLKSADLAFKYLLCKENLTTEQAYEVIKNINQKYYYSLQDEKSKLIDIYKSSTIIERLEAEVEKIKNQYQNL